MDILKTKLCIFLTIVIGVLGVKYVQKVKANQEPEPASFSQGASYGDVYEQAKHNFDKTQLEVMAQTEARKMVRTGDIDDYEQQLMQNGMLGW